MRLELFERETGTEVCEQPTRVRVVDFLSALRAGTLPDSRKPASDAYVANHLRHLVGFLTWSERRGYPVDKARSCPKVASCSPRLMYPNWSIV